MKISSILLYAVVAIIFMSGLSLLSLWKALSPDILYRGFQLFLLIFGIIHVIFLSKRREKSSDHKNSSKTGLTLIMTLIAAFLFMVVLYFITTFNNAFIYVTAFLIFPVPYLFFRTVTSAGQIPFKIYKVWFFDIEKDVQILESDNILLLQLRIFKTSGGEHLSTFTIRAPEEQNFGELFQDFIIFYNQNYPDKPVKHLDEDDQLRKLGWLFYTNTWWYGQRYLDPDSTVLENRLYPKQKIYAKRINL